ncbi:MAG: energy-coupling factor transporter transmembrane protein EcfT [Anaerolineae bacterium]|nr:energy-coupling factor transporter transmembrane protein EcfT [Anaerolineae bacterium]
MICAVTAVALLWQNLAASGSLTLGIILVALWAGIDWHYIRSVLLLSTIFGVTLLFFHGFFPHVGIHQLAGRTTLTPLFTFPAHWRLLGGQSLYREGLLYGLSVLAKTLSVVLIIPVGIFTTELDNLIIGLVRAGLPYKIAFIFSSTLRFFPLLLTRIQTITEAQRLRGLALEKMGVVQKTHSYAKIAVPLILGVLLKSQMLELTLQARAFSGSSERTQLHDSRWGPGDYLLCACSTLFWGGALIAYFGWGIGKWRAKKREGE